MSPFNRDGLLGGLRALAKKLSRRRPSSSKKTSPCTSACPYADNSTSSSSSSSHASADFSAHRRRDIRRVFAEYDRDGDGRISLPELTQMVCAIGDSQPTGGAAAEAAAMMDVTDIDGDGYIGFEEFQALMTAATPSTQPPRLHGSLGTSADDHRPHQQGLCSCPEQGTAGIGSDGDEEDLRLAFALYDSDGDGVITAQEIHSVLRQAMEATSITLADCRRMVQAVDRDGDGVVGFYDFAAMMRTTHPCACH